MPKNDSKLAEDPERRIDGFVGRFDPANQKTIRAVRAALRRRFPTAHELVYDNYNFFVIGYSPTPRPSDSVVSLTANASGVGLCFIQGASLEDPTGILRGSGNQTRSIRLPDADVLDAPDVAALVHAAEAFGEPFEEDGAGSVVIRSVSKKQRPRRKNA